MSRTVGLLGPGWAPWRGRWVSNRVMEHTPDGWQISSDERPQSGHSSFEEAVAWAWTRRRVRDQRPWAIGFLGFEACAEIAGGLPARPWNEGFPDGWWLVEPRPLIGKVRPVPAAPPCHDWRSSLDSSGFRHAVDAIRDEIGAGEVYQVNLTRRFERWSFDRLAAMLTAIADGGEPDYLAHLSLEDSRELVCGSMELLLRRRGEVVETCPIKGTRPRGKTADEDESLRRELAADPKEVAELAMIVDLERHDLGRVSCPGSVQVVDPGHVVSWPTVHHRVARIAGRLQPGLEWWQVLAAMVPGGSVTGCPKIAAMTSIARHEPVARGPYCGVLGVVTGTGDLELALPIRIAWRDHDRVACAAGCGIVWDSDSAFEELESRLKVARWVAGTDR